MKYFRPKKIMKFYSAQFLTFRTLVLHSYVPADSTTANPPPFAVTNVPRFFYRR